MLKRRLHFGADDGSLSPTLPPPPPPPEPPAALIVDRIIEAPPPEQAVTEPVARPVGGTAGSSFEQSKETLNATIEKTRPSIVSNTISGTGSEASATPTGSNEVTYETLTKEPSATHQGIASAVSNPTSTVTGPEYGTNATGAATATYPTLTGPANEKLVWTGRPDNGHWQYKGSTTEPLTDDVLGSAIHYSFKNFASWPQSRKEIFYQEMEKNGKTTLAQFNWIYRQNLLPYGSPPTPYDDPQMAIKSRLTGRGAGAALTALDSHIQKNNPLDPEKWNIAYNAKNLEPKDVLKALKSNGKSSTDNATIAESLAGSDTDDLGLGTDPSAATGPTVENHGVVTAQAEHILDAAAEPVLKNIDELRVDVSGDPGSIQSELTAVKNDLSLTAENLKNKESYKTRMDAAIAANTGTAEFTKITEELEQKRTDLQARLMQSIAASRQYKITGEIETHNKTLTEQKEALAKARKEGLVNLLPFLENTGGDVDAALEAVRKTEGEIKALEEEDRKLEETGNYHERYDAAVGGLAKFLTLQDELNAAARSANTEKMTELFKENGLDYPVIPTTAGLQKRTAAINAEAAVTTAQNAQVEANRATKNEKWKQGMAVAGRLNDGLKVGTDLLATGSGAISSVSEAKKAIDTLLGNDGAMGESFAAVQGDILADATKLKSSEDVLSGLTDLQTAARGEGNENPYGEGGSPAQRLAKLLDQPRSQRFGNALGVNEQGEDSLNFGRSQEDIVANNTEIASHTYEEKDNRYYVNEVQGGMKA